MSATVSGSDISDESPLQMVPGFLPAGEIIGWDLSSTPNPITKRNEYTYSVSIQTLGAFRSAVPEDQSQVMVQCDGPCQGTVPSSHVITMGKCDHLLCKACFGIVKNLDGSYGCSNFYCWADARESFRSEKAAYRKIIDKQICRARKLKKDGEDVKTCTEANLPDTPFGSEKSRSRKSKKNKKKKGSRRSQSSDVDSAGLIKRYL